VVLNGWDNEVITVSIYINPLTVWLWTGGVLLIFGTLLAMWPRPRPRRKTAPAPQAAGQLTGA